MTSHQNIISRENFETFPFQCKNEIGESMTLNSVSLFHLSYLIFSTTVKPNVWNWMHFLIYIIKTSVSMFKTKMHVLEIPIWTPP